MLGVAQERVMTMNLMLTQKHQLVTTLTIYPIDVFRHHCKISYPITSDIVVEYAFACCEQTFKVCSH